MKKSHQNLLVVDGTVNVILGILLLFFPAGFASFFGLPQENNFFYASILGAVLFGIGIALFQERSRQGKGSAGLGLTGAITINLCGSMVLIGWLLFGGLDIPVRGFIILWIVAILVLGIGLLEFFSGALKEE
ncbi:MAG: hypothetical protein P8Y60_04875 [Calditrichota bacterium]